MARRYRKVAEDFLAGDAAGGFDPADLMAEPKPINTAEMFEAKAEEAVQQNGTYGNCLGTVCLVECPTCLVEVQLDQNGNCPECGKYLGCSDCSERGNGCCRVQRSSVHFVEHPNEPAPVRKIC